MVESVQDRNGKSIDQSEIHGTRRHLTNPPKKRNKKTKPLRQIVLRREKLQSVKSHKPALHQKGDTKENSNQTRGSRRRNKKK